jgi:carbamoyltransferase
MNILGINESHTATAALLKDGEIVACVSEERFTRKKAVSGFPKNAVGYCLKEAGIDYSQIDLVVFGFINPKVFLHSLEKESCVFFHKLLHWTGSIIAAFLKVLSKPLPAVNYVYEFLYDSFYKLFIWPRLRAIHLNFLEKELRVARDKIVFLDHHTAHAYAAFYSYPKVNSQDYLIVTLDGCGDSVCGRIFTSINGCWQEIASTPNRHSLGYIYQDTTRILGMRQAEDEYKVMGLAPYASNSGVNEIYPVFKRLIWLEGLSFYSKIPAFGYYEYLKHNLEEKRFDYVAGAVQKLTEDLLKQLVIAAIDRTKINSVILGGGVFMNIKANMEIAALPQVDSLDIMPSAGDESTAIGA